MACALASRNAVQSYLAPSIKATPNPHNGGGTNGSRNPSLRRSRSLSPKASQRNRWCPPTRSPISPYRGANTDDHRAGAGESSGLGAVFEREGVPPLLLAPAEWGIGLSGEWVSARGAQTIRGARLTKTLRVLLHEVSVGVHSLTLSVMSTGWRSASFWNDTDPYSNNKIFFAPLNP